MNTAREQVDIARGEMAAGVVRGCRRVLRIVFGLAEILRHAEAEFSGEGPLGISGKCRRIGLTDSVSRRGEEKRTAWQSEGTKQLGLQLGNSVCLPISHRLARPHNC